MRFDINEISKTLSDKIAEIFNQEIANQRLNNVSNSHIFEGKDQSLLNKHLETIKDHFCILLSNGGASFSGVSVALKKIDKANFFIGNVAQKDFLKIVNVDPYLKVICPLMIGDKDSIEEFLNKKNPQIRELCDSDKEFASIYEEYFRNSTKALMKELNIYVLKEFDKSASKKDKVNRSNYFIEVEKARSVTPEYKDNIEDRITASSALYNLYYGIDKEEGERKSPPSRKRTPEKEEEVAEANKKAKPDNQKQEDVINLNITTITPVMENFNVAFAERLEANGLNRGDLFNISPSNSLKQINNGFSTPTKELKEFSNPGSPNLNEVPFIVKPKPSPIKSGENPPRNSPENRGVVKQISFEGQGK